MNKEEIKEFAIKILKDANLKKVESISITENTYDDGSPYVEISIDYKGGENE